MTGRHSRGEDYARHGNAALRAHEKDVASRPPVRIEQGDAP